MAALDVIVWAVDAEDNSLQSVADYLSGFAQEYLSNSALPCRFKIPVSFPDLMIDGRARHELLMTVKEALNNIVRHSGAKEVVFQMTLEGDTLEIAISDDGTGFERAGGREGPRVGQSCHAFEENRRRRPDRVERRPRHDGENPASARRGRQREGARRLRAPDTTFG